MLFTLFTFISIISLSKEFERKSIEIGVEIKETFNEQIRVYNISVIAEKLSQYKYLQIKTVPEYFNNSARFFISKAEPTPSNKKRDYYSLSFGKNEYFIRTAEISNVSVLYMTVKCIEVEKCNYTLSIQLLNEISVYPNDLIYSYLKKVEKKDYYFNFKPLEEDENSTILIYSVGSNAYNFTLQIHDEKNNKNYTAIQYFRNGYGALFDLSKLDNASDINFSFGVNEYSKYGQKIGLGITKYISDDEPIIVDILEEVYGVIDNILSMKRCYKLKEYKKKNLFLYLEHASPNIEVLLENKDAFKKKTLSGETFLVISTTDIMDGEGKICIQSPETPTGFSFQLVYTEDTNSISNYLMPLTPGIYYTRYLYANQIIGFRVRNSIPSEYIFATFQKLTNYGSPEFKANSYVDFPECNIGDYHTTINNYFLSENYVTTYNYGTDEDSYYQTFIIVSCGWRNTKGCTFRIKMSALNSYTELLKNSETTFSDEFNIDFPTHYLFKPEKSTTDLSFELITISSKCYMKIYKDPQLTQRANYTLDKGTSATLFRINDEKINDIYFFKLSCLGDNAYTIRTYEPSHQKSLRVGLENEYILKKSENWESYVSWVDKSKSTPFLISFRSNNCVVDVKFDNVHYLTNGTTYLILDSSNKTLFSSNAYYFYAQVKEETQTDQSCSLFLSTSYNEPTRPLIVEEVPHEVSLTSRFDQFVVTFPYVTMYTSLDIDVKEGNTVRLFFGLRETGEFVGSKDIHSREFILISDLMTLPSELFYNKCIFKFARVDKDVTFNFNYHSYESNPMKIEKNGMSKFYLRTKKYEYFDRADFFLNDLKSGDEGDVIVSSSDCVIQAKGILVENEKELVDYFNDGELPFDFVMGYNTKSIHYLIEKERCQNGCSLYIYAGTLEDEFDWYHKCKEFSFVHVVKEAFTAIKTNEYISFKNSKLSTDQFKVKIEEDTNKILIVKDPLIDIRIIYGEITFDIIQGESQFSIESQDINEETFKDKTLLITVFNKFDIFYYFGVFPQYSSSHEIIRVNSDRIVQCEIMDDNYCTFLVVSYDTAHTNGSYVYSYIEDNPGEKPKMFINKVSKDEFDSLDYSSSVSRFIPTKDKSEAFSEGLYHLVTDPENKTELYALISVYTSSPSRIKFAISKFEDRPYMYFRDQSEKLVLINKELDKNHLTFKENSISARIIPVQLQPTIKDQFKKEFNLNMQLISFFSERQTFYHSQTDDALMIIQSKKVETGMKLDWDLSYKYKTKIKFDIEEYNTNKFYSKAKLPLASTSKKTFIEINLNDISCKERSSNHLFIFKSQIKKLSDNEYLREEKGDFNLAQMVFQEAKTAIFSYQLDSYYKKDESNPDYFYIDISLDPNNTNKYSYISGEVIVYQNENFSLFTLKENEYNYFYFDKTKGDSSSFLLPKKNENTEEFFAIEVADSSEGLLKFAIETEKSQPSLLNETELIVNIVVSEGKKSIYVQADKNIMLSMICDKCEEIKNKIYYMVKYKYTDKKEYLGYIKNNKVIVSEVEDYIIINYEKIDRSNIEYYLKLFEKDNNDSLHESICFDNQNMLTELHQFIHQKEENYFSFSKNQTQNVIIAHLLASFEENEELVIVSYMPTEIQIKPSKPSSKRLKGYWIILIIFIIIFLIFIAVLVYYIVVKKRNQYQPHIETAEIQLSEKKLSQEPKKEEAWVGF